MLVPTALFLLAAVATASNSVKGVITTRGTQTYSCKCYADNDCWPSESEWTALNSTVGGVLRKVIPATAVCYNDFEGVSYYDAEACADVTAKFYASESWHIEQTVQNMWTYFSNNTCLPTTNPDETCTIGFYPEYVIMAETREQIQAGVEFVREHNIRLVIRNTGHDFLGRSTGFGSLAINTHSFKSADFVETYTGPGDWTGGAVKVGAGVQLREMYTLASKQRPPVVVVGGECPTVGLAGGYIQGGGHGPLSSWYGMAADNALSFDVLTVDGQFLTADAESNADLYWALKGGGPSTFAVVLSVTIKTHPEMRTAGAILNINSTHTNDTAVFWKGVDIFHALSNHYTSHGLFVYYELLGGGLKVHPFVAPNMDTVQLAEVLAPLFEQLDAAEIPYSTSSKAFPTFFDLYVDMFEDEAPGQNTYVGGRIFAESDIANYSPQITNAFELAMAPAPGYTGGTIGHIVGPGRNVSLTEANSAVSPVWRNASSFTVAIIAVDQKTGTRMEQAEAERIMTNVVGKALREASPAGGAYVNEGDLNEPDWQTAYWGDHYPRLLELKEKWDPEGVLYARTTPGTEDWEVIDEGTRLCRRI